MTKSRFRAASEAGKPCVAMLALALGLSGCAASYGTAAGGFLTPQIEQAYIPLRSSDFFMSANAAAVTVAPGVAVTNAHNANIVPPSVVIGTYSDYDLLYFRTDHAAVLSETAPVEGEAVIAYGQGAGGHLRQARGVIHQFWPAAFGFLADAGPGFSGGPVVDATTGKLVGITYGYLDNSGAPGRLMVAYSMAFVHARLSALEAHPQPSAGAINSGGTHS